MRNCLLLPEVRHRDHKRGAPMAVVTYRIISKDGAAKGFQDDTTKPLYVPIRMRERYSAVDSFGYLPPIEQPLPNECESDSRSVKAVERYG